MGLSPLFKSCTREVGKLDVVGDGGNCPTTCQKSHKQQRGPLWQGSYGGDSTDDRGPSMEAGSGPRVASPHGGDSTDDRGPSPVAPGNEAAQGLREVRRGARVGPTLVVLMAVNEMEVEAVVDTGAEVTIISEGFYQKLSRQEKRPEGPRVVIRNAEDGASMEAAQAEVRVRLGAYEGRWRVLVAPIREEVLLGLDLLQEADVQLRTRGSVYVQGQRVESQVSRKA